MEPQTHTIPPPVQHAAEAAGIAKAQAAQVAGTATDEAARIAGTAKESVVDITATVKEQAASVGSDVAEQGRQLLHQAKDQVSTTADQQISKVSGGITSITDQVTALLDGRSEDAEQVTEYARRAVRQVESFAARIDERGVDGVLTDVRSFARRKPGAFLLLAGAAGLGVGLLAKGARSGAGSSPSTGTGPTSPALRSPSVADRPELSFPTPPTVDPVAPYAPVPPVATAPMVNPLTPGTLR